MPYRLNLLLLVALLLSACGGRLPRPESGPGAPAAPAAVEKFLRFAGESDYVQMGWVFGTENGPVMEQWPRSEVEQRMYAISTVLQHDSYVIGTGSPVPGRSGRAMQFQVNLQKGTRRFQVPMVAVRGSGERWYVEQVNLEAITNVR